MSDHGTLGLIFALLALACGVTAALMHGGIIEALTAASGGFSALAAVLGYAAHTASIQTPPK